MLVSAEGKLIEKMLECFTTKQALCLKDAFISASSAFVQRFLP